jgi:hypothetical protein
MKRSVLLSMGLTTALMPATRLAADGGYFQLLGGALMPSQTQQRVAMAFYQGADDGLDRVTYVVQSTYTGNAAEFAWVIPAPATPTEVVAEGAENLLAPLDGETAPRFTLRQTSGGGHGVCGCAANGGNSLLTLGGGDQNDGTHVEAQGVAGIFEWAALTSTGGESLLTWLNTNGFAVPASAEGVLNGYIQNDWHFLALRIAQPEEVEPSPSGKIYIPPIRFTCQTSRRVYPMVISQVSAADPTEVIVYVLGAHRAEAANLANLLIDGDLLEYDPSTPSQTNYEALVDAAIAAHGGLGLVTEYAWGLEPLTQRLM